MEWILVGKAKQKNDIRAKNPNTRLNSFNALWIGIKEINL